MPNNFAGDPMLFADGVLNLVDTLKTYADARAIRRMVAVTEMADGSIIFNRVAQNAEDESLLAYIGMLDFAKMGFFSQGTVADTDTSELLDENGIGDTGWLDNEESS